jgi:hypothetical protein
MSEVTVRVGLLLAPYAFIVFGLRARERVAIRGHRRRYSLTRLGRAHYRTVQPYGPEWHDGEQEIWGRWRWSDGRGEIRVFADHERDYGNAWRHPFHSAPK